MKNALVLGFAAALLFTFVYLVVSACNEKEAQAQRWELLTKNQQDSILYTSPTPDENKLYGNIPSNIRFVQFYSK